MDLVDLAASLRDRGMSLAAEAQDRASPSWSDIAYQAIVMVARSQAHVHVDDIIPLVERPSHPNAWGSVWQRAIKRGVIVHSGQVRPCASDPRKHRHQSPVYASRLYGGAE